LDLVVVLEGSFAFSRESFKEQGLLRTAGFVSHVGYFRRKADRLVHVFGAHYDFSEREVGHPTFHVQMKSFLGLAAHVREQYTVPAADEDLVKGVLKTVRVPTAQMDPFSLVLQLCADHLVHKDSSEEEKAAFNSLVEKSAFWQGAAYRIARLTNPSAVQCYRAMHWYPVVH
jgi:hypothetical protein